MNNNFMQDLRLFVGSYITHHFSEANTKDHEWVLSQLNTRTDEIDFVLNPKDHPARSDSLVKLASSSFRFVLSKPDDDLPYYLLSLFALAFYWGWESHRVQQFSRREPIQFSRD